MFTVVELNSVKKSKIQVFMQHFRRAEIKYERIDLPSGEGFYLCKAELHRGKIPWKEIKENSPSDKFMLPFEIKDRAPLEELQPKVLPRIMLLNSAVDYMEKMNLSPSKTQLTVVDPKGIYLNCFYPLIKLASLITVVTHKEEEYTLLSDRLFESYGISLMLRRDYSDMGRENCFLLDYDGNNIPLSFKGTAFSKEKKYLLNGKSLTPGGFVLPSEYERLWQKNTDKLKFASALYELCKVQELEKLSFNELCS